ncbi:PAS domain S-box protein [Methylomonas sp. LL1]|uniref:PAS domain S-box protein n=1 Tax=Methylomonas sp. LL1 TaxID=2785785 RepID=UPI0018C3A726|nr:PAS domain S-box protein [Methylomonas sp. LL1]QPK65178.1 PAS domain S-box protein [Methylomonas sp. LL1]
MPANPINDQAEPSDRGRILLVVLVYVLFAAGWILLSDKCIRILFSDPDQIILASTLKGWLFVAITALLLYDLMRRWFGGHSEAKFSPTTHSRQLKLLFAFLATGILALAAAGITHTFANNKSREIARLQAIAELKSRQIADWLSERHDDAEFIRANETLAEYYLNWQASGDTDSGQRLQAHLEKYRKIQGFHAVTLLDPNGDKLWGSAESPQTVAPELQAAARLAGTRQQVLHVGLYRGVSGRPRLDFIAPLASVSGSAPLVVLHVDPHDWLFPTLQNWPAPSVSGETLIFRRDGDQILYLNELRHRQNTTATLRLPILDRKLLAAQAVQHGEIRPGDALEGLDYRGEPVIGVTQAVPGSDWFLTAKLDRSELYAEAIDDADWIGFSGLLILLITGAGFQLLKQNQRLALAQALQQSQAERIREMNLLTAIVDSSNDSIFAKDLAGRFVLFNRAAADMVGKPAEAVLGQNEYAIFPAEQADQLLANERIALADNRILTNEETLGTPHGEKTFLTSKGPLHDADGNIIGLFGICRDISERIRAEQALRESENRFRALVEQSLAGIYIIQDNNLRYVNPTFAGIFGYAAPEDLIDRVPVAELVSPEYREQTLENIRRLIDGELSEIMHFIVVALRRDGRRIDIEAHGSTIDYQGRPAVIGQVLDISERKQAELSLRQNQAFKHAILDSVSASIAVLDKQGVIIAVNQPWKRFAEENGLYAGQPAAQTGIGMNYLEICRHSIGFSSEGAQAARDGILAVLEARLPQFSLEYPCHSPTRQRWFVMHATPLNIAEGGVVISHSDITARKTAEETLKYQAEELSRHNAELERFNRLMTGRELDMIALKQRINALSRQLGREAPYPLAFLDDQAQPSSREDGA